MDMDRADCCGNGPTVGVAGIPTPLDTASLNQVGGYNAQMEVTLCPVQPTRTRLVELMRIANEVLDYVESQGVKRSEGCEFGRMIQRLWEAKR